MNTVNHYDDKSITAFNTADLGYATNFENIEAGTPSIHNRGLLTGTTTRVLDQNGNTFLHSTNLYDDKGRALQTTGTSYQGNVTRSTNQYDFSGTIRSTNYSENKTINGVGYDNFKIISKMTLNHAGRLKETWKNVTRKYKADALQTEVITATGDKLVMKISMMS